MLFFFEYNLGFEDLIIKLRGHWTTIHAILTLTVILYSSPDLEIILLNGFSNNFIQELKLQHFLDFQS